MSTEDFKQLASDAGVPTTTEEINAEFEALRQQEGLTITNQSAFGPFWRWVNAAATSAAKWLIDFIIASVLPQAFVKTATGSMLDIHAWAVNLTRKSAVVALGNITFMRADSSGELIIPSGTIIQSDEINGETYSLETISEVAIQDGVNSIDIICQALGEGSSYNLGESYYSLLNDPIDGVTVTNSVGWLIIQGVDTETDNELRNRIRNQYSAINQWHTDAVYTAIIASFDGVTTGNVYFEHDAPRGPGTANAFVMLETGNPTPELIASIQSEITDNGNHGHGDDLVVYSMPESFHDLSVIVWFSSAVDSVEIPQLLSDIENFIRCAFRENTSFNATKANPFDVFSFSRLGDEIHDSFPQVKNLVFNLGFINSAMDIPRLSSLTVSENA